MAGLALVIAVALIIIGAIGPTVLGIKDEILGDEETK